MDSHVGRKLADRIPETGRDGLEGDIQPRLEVANCSLEDTGYIDQTFLKVFGGERALFEVLVNRRSDGNETVKSRLGRG